MSLLAHPSLDTIRAECPRLRLTPGHFLLVTSTSSTKDDVGCLLALELDAVNMAGGNDRVSQVRQSKGGNN